MKQKEKEKKIKNSVLVIIILEAFIQSQIRCFYVTNFVDWIYNIPV